jgi:hypothetical protein
VRAIASGAKPEERPPHPANLRLRWVQLNAAELGPSYPGADTLVPDTHARDEAESSKITLYGPDGTPCPQDKASEDPEVERYASQGALMRLLAYKGESDDYRLDYLDLSNLLLTIPAPLTQIDLQRLEADLLNATQTQESLAAMYDVESRSRMLKLMEDSQKKLFEIVQDVQLNKPRSAGKTFIDLEPYIRQG